MSVQQRSNALQNEVVRLYTRFINDGVLSNPAGQPMVEILDCDGVTVLDTASAQIENTGVYYVDWYVPANLPLGEYYDRWTFQWSGDDSVEEITNIFSVFSLNSYINFLSQGLSVKTSNRATQLIADLKNNFIYEAQHIPIYWEQGRRIRQEDQQKRRKSYYYFELDGDHYSASAGDTYFHNGHKYTIQKDLIDYSSSSTSSDLSSESSSIDSSSSESVVSDSSGSSGSSSSSSSSSSIDSSSTTSSSSTSQGIEYPSSITYEPKVILTALGTGDPNSSGTLTKIEGCGSSNIGFTNVTKKVSKFSTIFDFGIFNMNRNWNMDPRPIVRLNNTRIIDDGWHADYKGKIYMDRLMAPEDYINVSYNLSYFSDEELLSFLKFGLQMMNTIPPASQQYASLEQAPLSWDPAIVLWAAITALKRLVFGLNYQEIMLIFGGPDNINSEESARAAQQTFKDLYNEYTELWKEVAENLKSKRLPGIALAIQPEYTLPGGRCMSSDTYIKSKVNNIEKELMIKDLFVSYKRGDKIEVLSMFENDLSYFPIRKIWKSGKKETYELKYKNGSIRLSKDHLVFNPDSQSYYPVSEIAEKNVMIFSDGKLQVSELLSKPTLYGLEEVYDVEVPIAENFLGNNLITHNSRWFRYLFKGGS